MRNTLIAMVLVLSFLTLFSFTVVKAQGPVATTMRVDEISSQLVCQCGCGSVLNNCVHQECMSRSEMRTSITGQLAQGKSNGQIVQAFVQVYGEKVLAEPPKKGFNLTAWIAPFVGLLVGAWLIFLLLRAWVSRGKVAVTSDALVPAPVRDEYRRRVEKELKDMA